jgi:hypothetical protein
VCAGLTGAILAITAADMVSLPSPVNSADAHAAADELRDYGARLDATLPPGCGVFELPAYPYPEGVPRDGTATYDPLLPYLFSKGPKWSYGGMKTTPAGDWQLTSLSGDTTTLASQLKAAGFCAVQVDMKAFTPEDSPTGDLRAALGEPIVTSTSGRWEMYSLDAGDARSFTAEYMQDPVQITPGFGMSTDEASGSRTMLEVGGTEGTLLVVNPKDAEVTGAIEFEALSTGCPSAASLVASTSAQQVSAQLPPDSPITMRVPYSAGTDSPGVVHLSVVNPCLADPGARITIVNPRFIPQ